MFSVTHRIANVFFHTESNTWLPRLLEIPFEWFRCEDAKPDVFQHIYKIGSDSLTLPSPSQKERDYLKKNTIYSPGGVDSPLLRCPLVKNKLWACIGLGSQVDVRLNENYIVIHDFQKKSLHLFCVPEYYGYRAEFHVAAYLPYLFGSFFPIFSAILIHAAGVILNERTAVFFAPDDGGKTTAVKLSNGLPILHDDHIVLRKEGKFITAYATPMGRNTSGPCQARIGGLFLLEKAPNFSIDPVHPLDLVQCLWSGNQVRTQFLSKDQKIRAFKVLYDTCHQAPVYRMQFPKNYIDWDAIDNSMAE